MQDEKNYDNVITLIIDILKAVVLFAFGEAIRNISYAIKNYRSNK